MHIEPEELDALRERRNEAQAELERYTLEQYPIDSDEKALGLVLRQNKVAELEEEMRHRVLDHGEGG